MKQASDARGFESSVELIRLLKGSRIDRDDRIEAGTFLVVRLDPVQVELDQLVGGQTAGFVGVLNILDCRFRNVKGFDLTLAFAWKKRDEKKQRNGPVSVPQHVPLVHMPVIVSQMWGLGRLLQLKITSK